MKRSTKFQLIAVFILLAFSVGFPTNVNAAERFLSEFAKNLPDCNAPDLPEDFPAISIIGTAVADWNTDVIMFSEDGENYTLTEQHLLAGELKFRQDLSWDINWGPSWGEPPAYPDGVGVLNGQNIPIPAVGNYDITFVRSTGEYHFKCASNCAPEIGITGTAVPPFFSYDDNYKMYSPDGENYFIPVRYFGTGEVKFRQLDNWDNNWGASEFPEGTAVSNGEGIPVLEAFYSVHFNINTLEYHFNYPFVGMVGDALDGWDNDAEMVTEDGIHYILPERYFHQGETKFRIGHNWSMNFGTFSGEPSRGFPAGPAVQDGMNIFVPSGFYTVSFNLQRREYSFEGSPCLVGPGDVMVMGDPFQCGAVVNFPEPFVNEMCGDHFIINQIEGLASGSFFPFGETHQVFVADNQQGEIMFYEFNVIVNSPPPAIPYFTAEYEMPWPPNHEMVPVTLNYEIVNTCSNEMWSWLWIWCNEPDDAVGSGETWPDWEILDDHHVMVRAERSGKGSGREYHIVLTAVDENWNINEQEVVVKVNHDMGKMEKSALIQTEGSSGMLDAEVWPNPASEEFTLRIPADQNAEMMLFNLKGQLILRKLISEPENRFGKELTSGGYLLQVRSGERYKVLKLVKE